MLKFMSPIHRWLWNDLLRSCLFKCCASKPSKVHPSDSDTTNALKSMHDNEMMNILFEDYFADEYNFEQFFEEYLEMSMPPPHPIQRPLRLRLRDKRTL